MKSLIVFLMLVALALPLFAGAQSEAAAPEQASISFNHWIGPEKWAKELDVWTAEFQQENPEINVRIEMIPWAGYWGKLQTAMAANMEADVMQMSGGYSDKFVAQNRLLELDSYLNQEGLSFENFYPAALQEVVFGGKMYSLPFGVGKGSAFYFNKTLLDQNGLGYPDNNWSFEDVIEMGQKITKDTDGDGKNDQWGFWITNRTDSWPIIWASGGQILNEDKTKCMLDQPEAIEGLQFMKDLIHKYKISPTPAQLEGIGDFFMTGKLVSRTVGEHYISKYSAIENFEWDFTVWPKLKNRRAPDVFVGGNQHAISANTEYPDQAWKFVYWMTLKHMENSITYGLGTPTLKEIAERIITPDVTTYRLMEQIADGHSLDFHPNWGEMVDIYQSIIPLMFNDEISVEEAAKTLTKRIDATLETF
ncbi:MAG TPA: sugar ABC transporter substrate-binding protein [bacterium]|nr:sugar ABC transporter substrate-binding protein [bacterium]